MRKLLMKQLFEQCNDLRRSFVLLCQNYESLCEAGMNASVTLGHSERNLKTFVEIGVQINHTIRRMAPLMERTEAGINRCMHRILGGFILEGHSEKYRKAFQMMTERRASRQVAEVMQRWQADTETQVQTVLPTLGEILSLLRTLRQHHNLLFTTVNMLKVEAAATEQDQSYNVLALAETLEGVLQEDFHLTDNVQLCSETLRSSTKFLIRDVQYPFRRDNEKAAAV